MVQINDVASNVIANLSAIQSLGSEAQVTLTDVGYISAATASFLVNAGIENLNAGNLKVSDTASQIAALAASGPAGLQFLTTQGSVLAADGNVTLSAAQTLSSISQFVDLDHHTIVIWDTAAHLTQVGAATSLAHLMESGLVSGIFLRTPGGSITLNASSAVALLNIAGLSIDNPDGTHNLINVSDSAAHLIASQSALMQDASSIAHIVVSGSATVTASGLATLQSMSAQAAPGVSLTLSDSAANILNATAVTGASISAAHELLSANGAVDGSGALALASLPGFSTNGHSLAVTLVSDLSVSVTQANALGSLGQALSITGGHFVVSGNVAGLCGLTSAGAGIAQVQLSDTLSNISALASFSPALSGTVSVSNGETLDAASVQRFLNLVSSAHISGANISFVGGSETVQDSVAALQSLATTSDWITHSTLQPHFSLVAVDTATNLASEASYPFLSGLPSTLLAGDATITAATGQVLASLSNFGLNGHALTISDTAINLLAAPEAEWSLANSVGLSDAATVTASQAEALLQIPNFHLTQPLTIVDCSTNLLDGTLAGMIASDPHIAVALAGPEVVDAPTAIALSSLQGFADGAHLTISDTSDYLLSPPALTAETLAANTTLADDETVSAHTVLRLSELPNFTPGDHTLTLAGDDFANAATLKAIADLGSHFNEGGHALYLTENDYSLTPTELTSLTASGYVANGHAISAALVSPTLTEASQSLTLSATGVVGASVKIYDAAGHLLSSDPTPDGHVTEILPDAAPGQNFAITEVCNSVESTPIVVLDATTLESAVSAASTQFASNGSIQVDSGKYINLYTQGAQLPNAPALVYNPASHSISLDIPGHAPVALITFGATTTPSSLDASDILFKHHG